MVAPLKVMRIGQASMAALENTEAEAKAREAEVLQENSALQLEVADLRRQAADLQEHATNLRVSQSTTYWPAGFSHTCLICEADQLKGTLYAGGERGVLVGD